MTLPVPTIVVGIDCATKPEKVGLALGECTGGVTTLRAAKSCDRKTKVIDQVCDWMSAGGRVLLAIDAPLGWPDALGKSLIRHFAGEPITCEPNALFHRATDAHVKQTYGKTPLEVGADRIARTAHAALVVLSGVRRTTGLAVPLAWNPAFEEPGAAIEVYPAATMAADGWTVAGYRDVVDGLHARSAMVDRLGQSVVIDCDRQEMVTSPDALDAAVCVLAGSDFLRGKCIPPADDLPVKREGWIWVAAPTVAPGKKTARARRASARPF